MLLLVATLLASTPAAPAPVVRTGVQWQLDVGGLLGSAWYVPESRVHLEAALDASRGLWRTTTGVDAMAFAYASPVVGSFLAASDASSDFVRAMLVTSGLLQGLGLTVLTWRLLADAPPSNLVQAGPTVSLSPIAAGGLGLSLRLTGW